jgi:hypothetical protein
MPKIHVTLDTRGRISNDSLGELREAFTRNKPASCHVTTTDLVSQVLSIAHSELRGAHVFEGTLPDQTTVLFTRDSPPAGASWSAIFSRQSENRS